MEELNKDEKRAFSVLKKEQHITTPLEEKIIKQLKKKALINTKSNFMKSNIFKIAASMLLFLSGFYAQQVITDNNTTSKEKNLYALFLYENDEFIVKNPNELVNEYTKWANHLDKDGYLAYAEKLNDSNRNWIGNVTSRNNQSKLTGYFVYSAKTYEEAKKIAETHPHTTYGGGIELIAIDYLGN